MNARFFALVCLGVLASPSSAQTDERPFQKLHIPEAISGTGFQLDVHKSSKSFWKGATTATYGFNNESFWGPTLILNQGDTVQMKVKNGLDEVTTLHWHGLHLPAFMDGGPHQLIQPGGTWTSTFVVKNNAATYWYHPHPHEATQKQLTYGAGGLIIIRDPIEARLALPRTYGIDDIPVVLTSRRFYANDQFSFEGDSDKYGDYLLTNGTLDAEVSLPSQLVRLRILNAEIERGYDISFSDNRIFHVIATDGGLVDKPIPLTRMKLMVGERVELLVNLGGDKPGSSIDLMACNSRQPFGFPGGEPGRSRPNGGYLNNLDFRLLHIRVGPPNAQRITKLPVTLTCNRLWKEADVNERRTVRISRFGPPEKEFAFDSKYFDMHTINHVVKLGAVEAWTISNDRTFGHSFHIHDVQFRIVSRSNGPVADYEQGWKDTLYVPRSASATFIAKFDDYASDTDPFMYHCHMANHEDGGLMGQFLVSKDPALIKRDASGVIQFRAGVQHPLTPDMVSAAARQAQTPAPEFQSTDLDGRALSLASLTGKRPLVLFFIERECPCSRDATPFLNQLHAAYGDVCNVTGVINATPEIARLWADKAGCQFPLIADPDQRIITAFGAQNSVYTTLVSPARTVVTTYPGYGREMLNGIAAAIARLGSVPARAVHFDAAPLRTVAGCPFN